jgi:hypothetical protein
VRIDVATKGPQKIQGFTVSFQICQDTSKIREKEKLMRLVLRIILGILPILAGAGLLLQGFNVPAIVATPYILAGVVFIVAGGFLTWIFRDKKKSIAKEAERLAEIERQKEEILARKSD